MIIASMVTTVMEATRNFGHVGWLASLKSSWSHATGVRLAVGTNDEVGVSHVLAIDAAVIDCA
jgi:hypothetical protein